MDGDDLAGSRRGQRPQDRHRPVARTHRIRQGRRRADPLIVRPLGVDEDGNPAQYGVIAGQRRLGAQVIANETAQEENRPVRKIPCWVIQDCGPGMATLVSLLENKYREEMTNRDIVTAVHQLSLSGMAAADLNRAAKSIGLKPEDIKHAKRARDVSDNALDWAAVYEFDLQELAVLADFQDMPNAVRLLGVARQRDAEEETGGGHWRHAVASLTQARRQPRGWRPVAPNLSQRVSRSPTTPASSARWPTCGRRWGAPSRPRSTPRARDTRRGSTARPTASRSCTGASTPPSTSTPSPARPSTTTRSPPKPSPSSRTARRPPRGSATARRGRPHGSPDASTSRSCAVGRSPTTRSTASSSPP
ncbi:hypothetical protein ACU686_26585 [Yinghuangia aomiensis]